VTIPEDPKALAELVRNLIGLVRELDTGSDEHTEYCMTPDCFRCNVAWGLYDIG
jgi:hypothetical protein